MCTERGEPFPTEPATGPIYVCTRNDALAGIIEATPAHRREDLVFMQNGMLGSFLEGNGLSDATQAACASAHRPLRRHFHPPARPSESAPRLLVQVLLYLAVAKLGEPPIDGITDTNPDGLTAAKGKQTGSQGVGLLEDQARQPACWLPRPSSPVRTPERASGCPKMPTSHM